ncbi:Beige/BEACH domain containing protein [Trichomonas vaginalis G3]|uniref:Beige/BEACH domain containing protein n=1 Tax=Trichomonas vaginalis (strain ATCC PRA-98 / G3) TaxID=412133 RepID=A2FE70_TRIV3|nr:beige/BEACH-related family [Trichomonas vaginalis G3]EAX96799.1 Beige/BEACH domain containing protein [Trichomonas vaginalis G3]KAI5509588.1 beige/BEACH-related family [Trichomonas vaginalis G3]|eukprot:XP_001309729.1 Beige/BEACH domain containing protein [Trichomonas vaginalis G3]
MNVNSDLYDNPVHAVLQLTNTLEDDYTNCPPAFQKYFKNVKLPKFNKKTLAKFDVNTESTDKIVEMLLKSGYSFPFFPQLIPLLSNSNSGIEYNKFVLCWVLNTAISYTIYFHNTSDLTYSDSVLKLLLMYTNSDYTNYIISCFIYVFTTISISFNENNIEIYMMILLQFFSLPFSHDIQSTNLIPTVLTVLLRSFEKNPSLATKFIDKCNELFENDILMLDRYSLANLLSLTLPLILELQACALRFLKIGIKSKLPCDFATIFSLLPRYMYKTFIETPNKISWEKKNNLVVFETTNVYDGLMEVVQNNPNTDTLEMTEISLPEEIQLTYMFPTESIMKLESIIDILDGKETYSLIFYEELLKICEKSEFEFIGNAFAGALYFAESISTYTNVGLNLVKSTIFDPHITYFDHCKGFKYLNSLRMHAVNLILSENWYEPMETLVLSNYRYPNLISELFYRITYSLPFLSRMIVTYPKLAKVFRQIFSYYRSLRISSTENMEYIKRAEISCYSLIAALFKNKEAAKVLISDMLFMTSFTLLLSDDYTRKYCLEQFEYLFSVLPYEDLILLFNYLIPLIANIIINIDNDKNVSVLMEIFQSLLKIFRNRNELKNLSEILIPHFSNLMENLQSSKESHKSLFKLTFSLLIEISIEIKKPLIVIIAKTIPNMFQSDCPTDVYEMLVKFMNGNTNNMLPSFILKNNNSLLLYFKVCFWYKLIDKCLDFAMGLIQFSPENAKMANKDEVDLFLLSQLENSSEVEKILDLFREISCIYSSPMVVKSYFTLLSPINNKLSKNHVLLMKTLSEICFNTYWLQKKSSLLGNTLSSNDFKISDNFTKGFSFLFWFIMRATDTTVVPIFNIEIDDFVFSIYIRETTLCAFINSNNFNQEIRVPYKFRKGVWYYLIMNYKINEENTELTIKIHHNELSILKMSKTTFDPENIAHARIGSLVMNNKSIIELGVSFLTSLLNQEQMKELSLCTPTSNISGLVKPLISFEPGSQTDSHDDSSFVYTIVKLWKFDIVLPLFSLFDIRFSDGSLWQDAASETVSILAKTLMSGDYAERYFFEQKKFSLIAHILVQYPPKTLTYKIYIQFFNLFEILNNINLRKHLFDSILAEPYIWITADAEDHLNILKHWSGTLFIKALKYLQEFRPLNELLNVLTFFYWYEDTSGIAFGGKDSKRPRDEKLDITKCRIEINNCIKYLASLKFTKDDLCLIIRTCYNCNHDEKQVISLLDLCEDLILSYADQKLIQIDMQMLAPLHDMLSRSEEAIAYMIIKVFIAIRKKNLMSKSDIYSLFDICIYSMNTQILSQSFFVGISSYIKQIPELFPMACWISFIKNDQIIFDDLIKNIQKLTPSQDYVCADTWFIWPLIAASKINKSDLKILISFMLNCQKSDINLLLNQLSVICAALPNESDDYQYSFLETALRMLESNEIKQNQENYLIVIKHVFLFLYLRKEDSVNTTLVSEFHKSPFISKSESEIIEKGKSPKRFPNGFGIVKIFKMSAFDIKNYVCGYRFDSQNSKWMDSDIADSFIKILSKQDTLQYDQLGLLMLSLVMKSNNKTNKSDLSLFARINRYTNHPADVAENFSRLYEQSIKYLDEMKEINNAVLAHHSSLTNIATNMITTVSEDIDGEERIMTQSYSKKMFEQHDSNEQWKRIISAMTAEKGPWSSIVPENVIRWKRENTACFALCPYRMKNNDNFDDHKIASQFRDSIITEFRFEKKKTEYPPKKIFSGSQYELITKCKRIKTKGTKKYLLGIAANSIDMVSSDSSIRIIPNSHVKFIFFRTRYHKPVAIEIFTFSGKSFFLEFVEYKSSFQILEKMSENLKKRVQTTGFLDFFSISGITEKWVNNKMSNFSYLMNLNVYSGRTFNDMSQYPIFPLVLVPSETYDLNGPKSFRDLSKPIGAQDDEKLQKLIEKMNDNEEHFLYTSGPISSLVICHYLIRIEPFTTSHIELQSGKFDVPDRIFFNYNASMKNIYVDLNDNRELIPEFFFQPEFLKNQNNFDLGRTQTGIISDVILPEWASSPLDFIYKQRKALESQYVSAHLHEWIDLMWGYKQRGEEAEKANNLYDPNLYEDVWEKNKENLATKTFLKLLGQIPPHLFNKPHPRKVMNQKQLITVPYHYINQELKSVTFYYGCADMNGRLILIGDDSYLRLYSELITDDEFELIQSDAHLITSKFLSQNMSKDMLFSSGSDFIVTANKHSNQLFVIGVDKAVTFTTTSPHKEISNISADGNYFATTGTDNMLYIYRSGFSKKISFSTHVYRETVTSMCVSDSYKVVVCGTRDGGLIVTSLTDGITVRVMDVHEEPVKICVTQQWGFIVCLILMQSNFKIVVFTINGEFVNEKTVRCDSQVTNMYTFSTYKGFDYICVVNSLGKLLVAEVYTLDFNIYSPGLTSGLCALTYSQNTDCIVLMEKTGKIIYQPINTTMN